MWTSASRIPTRVIALLATSWAATVAAKAEDFLEPEKLTFPAEAQQITRPRGSVIAISYY